MFLANTDDWTKIAETIRNERLVGSGSDDPVPASQMYILFGRIQNRFNQSAHAHPVDYEERAAICELLWEIFTELNTLRQLPFRRNYKTCFLQNASLIDEFIKTFKMVDNYNNKRFSAYGHEVIAWLEQWKKENFDTHEIAITGNTITR